MKKLTAVLMILAMILSIVVVNVSAANGSGEDPTPVNVGIATTKGALNSQYDVSYVRQFVDGNGTPWLAGGGVGAHGGHETRIVRTPSGTYATYITNATGNQEGDNGNNNHWWAEILANKDTPEGAEVYEKYKYYFNGIATFDVIKITSTGFESIYQGEYPQAAGSCTPNVLFDGDHTVYVTIIADDKDRYGSTMGTAEFTNGIWLEVIEIDTDTDTVVHHAGPAFYDHTTTPFEDHGYGYSQPCLDVEHGKLYCITNGGEAEDPNYTGWGNQSGYMAWWVYDLDTHTWDPNCRTMKFFSRRCYMNVYPDGNGGFTMVTERCAPTRELGLALGCTFSTSGYLWDALYVMHIANPLDDCYIGQKPADVTGKSTIYEWTPDRDTVIWEPTYVAGAKNNVANASHYGTSGCTYLDKQNRIHVIYTVNYYSPSTSKNLVTETHHAIYSLSGAQIYDQPISIKGPSGFAMTQGVNGNYYIFTLNGSSSGTKLEIWSSSDGLNFTKTFSSTALVDQNGNNIPGGSKPIIANTRNGSVIDDTVALMFHTSGTGGDPYYYFSVQLPSSHKHRFTSVTTQPTCTERGYRTRTCTCGAVIVDNYKNALGHDYVGTVTEPTEEAGGYTTYICSRCQDTYVGDYTAPLLKLTASLCLEDSTDLNVYVNNVTAEMVSEGYYVEYRFDEEDRVHVAFSDAEEVSEGKYKFSVASYNANELAKSTHFGVYDATGAELKYLQYSVKDYCDSVIADPEQPEGLKNVCKALMAYGYFAQERFDEGAGEYYAPDPYSDAIDAVNALDVNDMDEYESHAEYIEPVTGVGASLALKSKTELSFFIKGVSDVGDFSLTVGGQDWEDFEVVKSKTKCRVIVKGLRPVDLASTVEFQEINGLVKIDYSPMAYARYVVASGADDREVNLCKALYLYAMAAIGYFPAD